MAAIPFQLVASLFDQVGLSLVGVTGAEPLGEQHRRSLALWQEQRLGADMHYLYRDPALLVAAQNLLPGARAVVMVAAPYDARPAAPTRFGYGKVARYAWGRDYHKVLPRLLQRFATALRAATGDTGLAVRSFADAIPLLERPYAARSGLGFIGKHSLLIRPGVGSLFLLGGVVLNRDVVEVPRSEVRGGCGTCFRCATQCPTNAIISPYTVDARRCISYLTIEKRGLHAREERAALGHWIFGCDECQEVCPHNARAFAGRRPDAVPGLEAANEDRMQLQLDTLMEIRTSEAYLQRFAGTPLMRPKREGLLRNGIAVAVNTQYDSIVPRLEGCVREDLSEVVRATALWGILALAPEKKEALEPLIRRDPSPMVQTEWQEAREHPPELR